MKEHLGIFYPYISSLIVIIGTLLLAGLFNRLFGRFIKRNTELLQNDPTNYKFLRHAIRALIFVVGFSWAIYFIPELRTVASSLLAGAGILAVAVGFASQEALSNIISGLFIVIFRPYRINDRLTIRDTMAGVVEDITLRHTVIRDFENRRIVIPNTIISNEVIINADMTDERVCRLINIGISYDSDIDLARKIIKEVLLNHPFFIDHRTPLQIAEGMELVPVRLLNYGESSINIRAWAWAKDQADGFVMQCEALESIKKRFDLEGIEIPFPYRTLVFKQPNDNFPPPIIPAPDDKNTPI